MRRLFVLALVLACPVAGLWCATLERLSFEDMAVRLTMIVRGKVMDSWPAMTNGVIYTHYRIQVAESFKGAGRGTVEIMVPGGTLNGMRQAVSGTPVLTKGDEFVFFLWTSKGGITWITGLTQGLFALPADGTNDPMARRSASPELMLDPRSTHPVKDVAVQMRVSEIRSRIAAALAAKGGGE